MKKLILAAAAAASFAMIAPAAAQSVTIGVGGGNGYHRDGVVVQGRNHMRPRGDRVVVIKKKRPYGHAYGWQRPRHNRTVIIER